MKKKAEGGGAPGGSCEITTYTGNSETVVKVACLEHSINHINDTLCRFEKRFDKIDDHFNEMRAEFKDVRKEMKYDFRFLIGAICALAGVMAHGFHWI